ncbi:DNA-methyltransferase [Brenneria corticis]|uniref:Methyltransferase n=1 Tax=Brenneria corticis TaxID=2173106 RepID=A0A2U1TM96_9GAMM|nr:site-specific DNA-methyltransferase [Brenneria sp. CFCC 11842]PWC10525.1 site-specific DNA-methyltransferase [Brenneria sp. CFCC 11842]
MSYQLHVGDCLESLRHLPEQSVHCCVTSPPYYGLRDYGVAGQIGLEQTPDEYIAALVAVFRETRRVLRDDGTLWLNIGDSYAGTGGRGPQSGKAFKGRARQRETITRAARVRGPGLKEKDLVGIPWMLAFALRADGWYLRQEIIWHKTNPMPESVTDRCTKAHEQIFLLSKSPRYFFDSKAIKEPVSGTAHSRGHGVNPKAAANAFGSKQNSSFSEAVRGLVEERNRRTVWLVPVQGYTGAHFATFPPSLIEPCILAGSPQGGVVLDPFGGSGTTAGVALAHNRRAVLCELNPEYAALIPGRVSSIAQRITGESARQAMTEETRSAVNE